MTLRNTSETFGLTTRAIHWLSAALLLTTLPLGAFIARMEPALSTLWLYGFHKTLGMTALALVVLRIVWHGVSPPPAPLPSETSIADKLAPWAHRALYLLLLLVPLSGWIASSATGIDTVIFGSLTVPAIAPASRDVEEVAFAIHRAAAWSLAGLVVVHISGALLRVAKKDGTLRRMVLGSSH